MIEQPKKNYTFQTMFSRIGLTRLMLVITFCSLLNLNFLYIRLLRNINARDTSSLILSPCDKVTGRVFLSLPKTDFKLNYTNSSTYTGPIVKGWPPNISRELEHYVPRKQDTFTILPRNIDPRATELLIIIKSRIDGYERRNEVRRSWGKHLTKLNSNSRIVFLIGKNTDGKYSRELQYEIKMQGDILQATFVDSYHNLTLKTVSAYKFAAKTIQWVHRPKIIITMDDDVFMNVPVLLKKLNELNSRCEGPYLLGDFIPFYSPVRDSKEAKFSSKWGVPSYMLADGAYPPYIHGMVAILSFESVRCLFEESYHLPYFHIEDVFMTGFSAHRCGIAPQKIPGIVNRRIDLKIFNVTHHIAFPINEFRSEMYQKIKQLIQN